MHHVCVLCLRRSEGGIGFRRIGIIDGCEPPCGCWELNLGPLQKQHVLLTTDSSLQPHISFFLLIFIVKFVMVGKAW